MGLYSGDGGLGRGTYTHGPYGEEKHFNFQSVKLNFLSFFQYKARIFAFFTSCKMWNKFKVNNKDSRIRKFKDKIKNKGTIHFVLASLLLSLNALQCYSVSIVDFYHLIAGWRLLFLVLIFVPAGINLGKVSNCEETS